MAETRDEIGLVEELSDASLGDSRRSVRLGKIVGRLVSQPEASFPRLCESESELEGFYRFFSNDHVDPNAVLAPHVAASVQRAQEHETVVLLHDTTTFKFSGEREGLGRLAKKDHGFWAHVALAATLDRETLGVAGLRHGTRLNASAWKGSKRVRPLEEGEELESERWWKLVEETAETFENVSPIHVMDREADSFELLAQMCEGEHRFVVRSSHDRVLDGGGHISDALENAQEITRRTITVSKRGKSPHARKSKRHPPRNRREATLSIRAVAVNVGRSQHKDTLSLHVVHVVEVDPPEGEPAVEWRLLTREPIDSAEDVSRVVDLYRARWTIEELFKALKTGCAYEKRQLGSYNALVNALAVFLPVAWHLLRLREVGRRDDDAPANSVLPVPLLALLIKLAKKPMPEEPTARDVMLAIAALGGHLKRNGQPGWLTLARGYERLLEARSLQKRLKM